MTASVAVVVPTFRPPRGADERTSLRHLEAHLNRYDGFVVCPESAKLDMPGFVPVRLDDRHFRSRRAYQRLLLNADFYRRFEQYEFILVHHLDCLVFSDDLQRWRNKGYDYVGAPWVRRGADGRLVFTGVGNGGLSLRRVETFLRVLEGMLRPGARLAVGTRQATAVARRLAREPRRARQLLHDWYLHEDKFWSVEAPRLSPGFRIPPPEVAVAFAWESHPRFCLEQNRGQLPFGCHRWREHDPQFWEPHVLGAV